MDESRKPPPEVIDLDTPSPYQNQCITQANPLSKTQLIFRDDELSEDIGDLASPLISLPKKLKTPPSPKKPPPKKRKINSLEESLSEDLSEDS